MTQQWMRADTIVFTQTPNCPMKRIQTLNLLQRKVSSPNPVEFEWTFGGKEVMLVGFFNSNIVMKQEGNTFKTKLKLFPGNYFYSFIVDGKERFAPEQETMAVTDRILNFVRVEDDDKASSLHFSEC